MANIRHNDKFKSFKDNNEAADFVYDLSNVQVDGIDFKSGKDAYDFLIFDDRYTKDADIFTYIDAAKNRGFDVNFEYNGTSVVLAIDGEVYSADTIEGMEALMIGDVFPNLNEAIEAI